MILQLNGISKRFGGLQAVSNCSFTVEKGKVVALIGPNGAGKTTIFNLITGALKPDSGSIYFKGKDITNVQEHKRVHLGMARSFQDVRALTEMTVLENVILACPSRYAESPLLSLVRPNQVRKEESHNIKKVFEILEYVGLSDKKDKLAGDLSYAEQKLLILARLLATDAELLLLDEPASGLDPGSLRKFVELIRDLTNNNKTILIVEHNVSLVSEISDKMVFLHHGEALAEGKPDEVAKNEELRDIYFGA
ncbi:ABC transporter ATP-binding protein [Bacillus dakarensis]|uniref:ABC transporter ATP-binding protein n=1 Tax=Robertmurraya dakarensis TaxID=1926278 RepID=UPI00137A9EA3|nr:ABC transporter ATP-binding protein [Bacillus dakarensis]